MDSEFDEFIRLYQQTPFQSVLPVNARRDVCALYQSLSNSNAVTTSQFLTITGKSLPLANTFLTSTPDATLRCSINGSETAAEICTIMFGDDDLRPARSNMILNILSLTDCLLRLNPPLRGQLAKKLQKAATENHERALFRQPDPPEDCAICAQPLPYDNRKVSWRVCCGKHLCQGCLFGIAVENRSLPCPFCRTLPYTSNGEYMQLLQALYDKDDRHAIYQMGNHFLRGEFGLQRDVEKAMNLWKRADIREANYSLAVRYTEAGLSNRAVSHRAVYYYEKAAIQGDVNSRFYIGVLEENFDSERSMKHFIIAAEFGHDEALAKVKDGYLSNPRKISKDCFAQVLRKHHSAKSNLESPRRRIGEFLVEASGVQNGV